MASLVIIKKLFAMSEEELTAFISALAKEDAEFCAQPENRQEGAFKVLTPKAEKKSKATNALIVDAMNRRSMLQGKPISAPYFKNYKTRR